MSRRLQAVRFTIGTTVHDIPVETDFEPVFEILFGAHILGGASAAAADASITFGVAAGATEEFSTSSGALDDEDPTHTSRTKKSKVYSMQVPGTSNEAELSHISFEALGYLHGFTVHRDNTNDGDLCVFGLAGGGEVLVHVGSFSDPAATGNQDIPLDFSDPDCVIFFSDGDDDAINAADETHYVFCLGFADSSGAQCAIGVTAETNVGTSDDYRFMRSGRCIGKVNLTGGVDHQATYVPGDPGGTGMRITWNNVNAPARIWMFAAFKNIQAKVTTHTISNSGTSQTLTGSGFTPNGVLMFSHLTSESAASTSQNSAEISIGCATAADEQGAVWNGSQDAQPRSVVDNAQAIDKCLLDCAFGTGAVAADLALTEFNSNGGVFAKTAPAADFFLACLWMFLEGPDPLVIRPYKRDRHHVRGSRFAQRAEAA